MSDKSYLGDGVYIEWDDHAPNVLRLTTENGVEVQNEIFLEEEVYNALLDYVTRTSFIGRATKGL